MRLDERSPAGSGSARDEAAVAASRLDIGHPGDVVVSGIDLVVPPRSSLALVGTNGSGKSTLIRTVIGLIPSVGGSIEVFGAPPGRRPTRVAYVAQSHAGAHVLPIRVLDVVRMARFAHLGLLGRMSSTDHDLVRWAMEAMGVADLGRAALRSLSGGQRQRVHLAQALARRADLIVLDEPTAGLDAGGRERYLEAFAGELHRGAAIVTATHDIGEAAEYDQVLLLARRVVALGGGDAVLTPDRLLETFGVVIHDTHEEHAGRFTVAERGRGGPQTIETRRPDG